MKMSDEIKELFIVIFWNIIGVIIGFIILYIFKQLGFDYYRGV